MSIESLKDKELNQSQIDIVSGGDYEDIYNEKSKNREEVKCLYSVGQYVEVYNTGVHITTKRAQITAINIAYGFPQGDRYNNYSLDGYYYPLYTVRIEESGETRDVISDEIES